MDSIAGASDSGAVGPSAGRGYAVLETGALQSAIFNSANFSSIATDAQGVIQIFNVGAERMLGYAAKDVVNKITPADISDPDELIARASALSVELGTPIMQGFDALVFKASRGIEDIYELTYIRKDGSRFPAVVSVTALRDADSGIIGYLLIGTDNTARKQAEEALLKAGALQKAIFDSANFSSIATDSKGVIQIFNVGAERMLGYSAAEVMNRITPADISDPEELIARARALSLELQTPITPGFEALVFKASRGIEDIYELTYIRKDGTRFPAVVSVTALRDEEGAIIGYLLIGTDNTARQQAEEERRQLDQRLRDQRQKNAELENASRMKSAFLANMSHELRTPLNAIIGFSEVLRDGLVGELTEKQRGFIGDIFSSGNHLLSLINDILDLSKVEAGKMLLDLETIEVSSIILNSLSIIREKASARDIRLSVDAPEELGLMQADARKVKQIIYNLLSNAVKFTADGGQVALRAARVPMSEVGRGNGARPARTFPLPEGTFSEFLEISVTDSGIGLSQQDLGQLFKPFSQLDSGLSRRFEGTGLGLAMVKLLASLHGGNRGREQRRWPGLLFFGLAAGSCTRGIGVPATQAVGSALGGAGTAHCPCGRGRRQFSGSDPLPAGGRWVQGSACGFGGDGPRHCGPGTVGADHFGHHAPRSGRLGNSGAASKASTPVGRTRADYFAGGRSHQGVHDGGNRSAREARLPRSPP